MDKHEYEESPASSQPLAFALTNLFIRDFCVQLRLVSLIILRGFIL
jgi:hypothetical protein